MTYEKNKGITALSALCLLFPVLIAALGVYNPIWLPLIALVCTALLSVSFILLPIYTSAFAALAIFLSTSLLSSSYYLGLLFTILIIPPSVAFAIAYKLKRNLNSTVAIMTFCTALFAAALGCLYIYKSTGELNYNSLLTSLEPVKRLLNDLLITYQDSLKNKLSQANYNKLTEQTVTLKAVATDYIIPCLPGYISAYILIQCFFSMLLSKTILRSIDKDISHIEDISRIRIAKPAAVLFVISYIGLMAFEGPLGLTFTNLVIILSLVFTCSGISSLYFFMSFRKRNYQKVFSMITLLLLNFIPFGCGIFLTVTGVFDTFFNYRKFPDPSNKDVI